MLQALDHCELLLFLLALNIMSDALDNIMFKNESLLAAHIREQKRLNRSLPDKKKRVPWSHFRDKVTDKNFRRMFRMDGQVFDKLCQQVSKRIGRDKFKPEEYLMKRLGHDGMLKRISGEVKMAICIRMLAGGSYLDLLHLFDVSMSHLYHVFDKFLDWILQTFQFPLVQWNRQMLYRHR